MAGIFLEWRRDKKSALHRENRVKVSVIIPIHNESGRMEGLLRTLLVQNYNAQIIFIDDRSDDESPAMLLRFKEEAAKRGILDCSIITLTENPGPNRKQFALSRGIAEANGDFFLFTDGDCEVPPDWIAAMTQRIQNEKTGAVIGPVFKKNQGKGFFFLYQCYDHAIRYSYLAGATGLGAAGGGFGNNLIISRKALEKAGGYDAVPPSPTEDAALISQIRRQGEYSVRAITACDAVVVTEAEKTWSAFINQTLRWNNGGLFSPELITRINFNILMIIIGAGMLIIPVLPFIPGLWPLPAAVLVSMIANSTAVFSLFRAKLPRGSFLITLGYLLFLVFTPAYFTLLTLMGYAGIKPTWKKS